MVSLQVISHTSLRTRYTSNDELRYFRYFAREAQCAVTTQCCSRKAVQLRADHVTQNNRTDGDGQTFWEPGVSEGQPVASWLIEIGTHFTTVWCRMHWAISEAWCWCLLIFIKTILRRYPIALFYNYCLLQCIVKWFWRSSLFRISSFFSMIYIKAYWNPAVQILANKTFHFGYCRKEQHGDVVKLDLFHVYRYALLFTYKVNLLLVLLYFYLSITFLRNTFTFYLSKRHGSMGIFITLCIKVTLKTLHKNTMLLCHSVHTHTHTHTHI